MKKTSKTKPAAKAASKTKSAPKAKLAPKAEKVAQEPVEPLIVAAAMQIAGEEGWDAVSSAAVAECAGLPLDVVREICPDKVDVLRLLIEEVNIRMLEGGEVDGDVRDNLFELMMRRLEAMQEYRAGILAVVAATRREPVLLCKLSREFHDTLGHVLDMAGVNPSPLHRAGLAGVVLSVFHTWCEDESADMAATMSMLDKRLGQAGRVAESLQTFLKRAA